MLQNLPFTFKIVFKRRRGGPTVKRNLYLINLFFLILIRCLWTLVFTYI